MQSSGRLKTSNNMVNLSEHAWQGIIWYMYAWFSAEIVVNARMSLVDFKIANYIGFLGAYIF